jgi:hypothetical protein
MNVKSSIGWSLLGVGIGYQISQHIQIAIETFMIEDDIIKVKFQTSTNEIINSSVLANYGIFPLKFKFTIRI